MSERPVVFVHGANMSSTIDYGLICDTLLAYGIKDLVVEVGYAYVTRYPSEYVPQIYTDQLTPAINACHARGMKVHASFNILLGALTGRGLVSYTGAEDGGFSCGLRMRQNNLMENLVKECVSYGAKSGAHIGETIDGFMTDYLRFGEAEGRMDVCYCPLHRAAFEAYLGEGALNWANFYPNGSRHSEFIAWRHIPYNELARDIAAWAKQVNPNIEISSAVWPILPGNPNRAKTLLGQDWSTWQQNHWVDWIAPMIYTTDATFITAIMQETLNSFGKPVPLMPFMANAFPGAVGASIFAAEIEAIRQNGSDGWVVWRYGGPGDGTGTAPDIRPYLDLIISEQPPPPPPPTEFVTPWTGTLEDGTYRITVPQRVQVGSDIYNFKQWEDGSTNPARLITLTANKTMIATYELVPPTEYTLVISTTTGGTTEPVPGSYAYPENTTVKVTAKPDVNYNFNHWILDGIEYTTNPLYVVMNKDKTLTAYFSETPPPPPPTYNLTIVATAGGNTEPVPGVYEADAGDIITVIATSFEGYVFKRFELDGEVKMQNPINVGMDADHTLLAVFETAAPPIPASAAILFMLALSGSVGALSISKKGGG